MGELPGVTLYNVDSLGVDTRREVPAAAAEIVERHLEQMAQWENYRSCLPGLERVKQAVAARVLSTDLDGPEARAWWSWPWGGRWTSSPARSRRT